MITFKRSNVRRDLPRLMAMDKDTYRIQDRWDKEMYFEGSRIYLVELDGQEVAWLAFDHDMKFTDGEHWRKSPGALYLGNTGILPNFRTKEVEEAVVAFQIKYAMRHGFRLISTNERESNPNVAFFVNSGFTEVKRTDGYWEEPDEPNIVLEMVLPKK